MVTIQEINSKLIRVASDIVFIKELIKDSRNQNTTDHYDIMKQNRHIQSTISVYNTQIKDKIEKLSKENINLSDAILKTIDDKCLTFKATNKTNTKRSNNDKPKTNKPKAKNSYEDLSATDNTQESK